MNAVRTLLAAAVFLLLAGCLEVDTHIAVNGDGSGTISERIVLKGAMAQLMQQLGEVSGGLADPAKARERASELGAGVSVVSVSALPRSEGIGALAVFAFQDLNTVRIRQDPTEDMELGGSGSGGAPADTHDSPAMHFRFEPGSPATITILLEQARSGDGSGAAEVPEQFSRSVPAPVPDRGPEQVPEAFRQMLEDLRLVTTLTVAGEILQTNASHRDGSRVTLLELDLNELLVADPGIARKLAPGTDLARMKAALAQIPGIRIELEPEVRIVFRPGTIQASVTVPAAIPTPAPPKTAVARASRGDPDGLRTDRI